MRRDVAGHRQAGGLRPPHEVERARRSRRGSGGGAPPGTSRTTSARIARSRATAASSAAAGQPRRPRTVATNPSFASAPAVSGRVLGVVDDRQPERAGVGERVPQERRRSGPASRRRRSRRRPHRPARPAPRASRPPDPPSPRRTPAPGPANRTRRPRRSTRASTAGSSSAGVVFGIRQTVVKPPCAAAASPDAIVSASSLPGSRKWAWRSMKPGATTTPRSSMPLRLRRRRARRPTRGSPSRTTMSPGPSRPPPGRRARPG